MSRDAESSGTAVDRISNMPSNIKDLILERLSIHDAAKMGVLSTTWRDLWVTNPHLVFDDIFFSRLHNGMKRPRPSKSSRIISNILLAHIGPILNFTLHIPMCSLLHNCSDKEIWIKNISKNGVRNLKLINPSCDPYKIPSSLFSCLDLTHLNLSRCMLNPPRKFGGFCYLVNVELHRVKITGDMSFGTQLEELVLHECSGMEHLGCQFKNSNNLTLLKIETGSINKEDIDLGWFECVQKVTNLSLMRHLFQENSRIEINNLDKLLGNMSRINSLLLGGFSLESLKSDTAVLKRPMATLENLYIHSAGFCDSGDLHYVLCLIKSSPNLRYLYISLYGKVNRSKDANLSHLTALQSDMIMDQLENVEIYGMTGTKPELQFVKLLLESTPSLRLLKLNMEPRDNPLQELRIAQDLLLYPRASSRAQIIWAEIVREYGDY
ncbi:F-box/FBD/LRR-repeat protein At1g13570-like [Apium graveolens]|uniref:F-box/FBD/LRR-repeat protein At1g13570-like n=1 Tax=Apium graveolens TaxID=4045 RepID=UPI003D7B5649